jgi:hypothetical protein
LTEETHLTPHVRASAASLGTRVTGSFDGTRIGGGAFDRLKAGESAGKTPKQAQISLKGLWKILSSQQARQATYPLGGRVSSIWG